MQQIYEKSSPQTLTIFSSINSPKKWTTVPNFMLTANFQHHSKTFGMFQLQRSWLNSHSVFRDLVGEIASFNKELMEMKNTIEIPNYLKTYHLYKNLHEQLQTLNSIASSIKQAKQQLDQIKKNFLKEKISLRQLKKPKLLPGINQQAIDPDQEQNLRKTMRQIQARKEYEVHTLMPRTYYAQSLPYKGRTFEYRNQQESMDMSQTVSVFSQTAPYESRILKQHPSVESIQSKSKSVSNLESTTWTSQVHNYSNFLNKNSKLSNSPKVKPFSYVLSSDQKNQSNQINRIRSRSVSDFQFTPTIPTKFNKHSEKIIDTMINKDKIQKLLCEPDPNLIKNLVAKDLQKPLEIPNLKSSRVSFILKPQKSQLIDRKQFISVKSQLGKFKNSSNRLRTDLNRKLQLHKYLSNHILQLNTQVSKDAKFLSLKQEVGKKLIKLSKKEIDLTHNQKQLNESAYGSSKLKVIPEQNLTDLVELKKRQFEQALRKQSVKSSLSSYMKYINHLQQTNPEDAQNNSQLSKTVSSNFSSHFEATRKSFVSHSEKKFQPLTTFRSTSLQKNFGPHKGLNVIKALNKHSIQRNNQEILDEVVKLKLRMAESENSNNLNAVIKNKLLFKGLQLHHAPQDTEYQIIQPKLFSNPFFEVPKASKKTKKKKK